MLFLRHDYEISRDQDWRAVEHALQQKQERARKRAEQVAARKAARECHARPNDHAQRFDMIPLLHNNGKGVHEHGSHHGFRARKHIGIADDLFTAAPDDDLADILPPLFWDMSGGRYFI